MSFSNFPESLRKLPQWVLWKKEQKPDGKFTKIPYQANGRKAASTRPEDWATFDECLKVVDKYSGLGFVFSEGIVGIDLDHCIDENGVVALWARDVLDRFPSYTEFSPSGDGLHIIIESDVALKGRKMPHVECYTSGRFFTVTGQVFEGRDTLKDCDVTAWYDETFGADIDGDDEPEIVTLSRNLPDDETVKRVMFSSKNGVKLRSLYERGEFLSQGYGSQSEADLALAGALMFFCGNDRGRVSHLFRLSKLYRLKWDEKHGVKTYGEMTMDKAASREVMSWDSTPEFIVGGREQMPLLIIENIRRAAMSDEVMKRRYRLNDFSHMIEVDHGGVWENLQDIDILQATVYISTQFECFARVSKEMATDAVRFLAYQNRVNPQLDFFNGLVWDKESRLDEWLHRAFGTPLDELHASMGANWVKGLVKRVIEPGYRFDEVLVLEGRQGMRKSTAMHVIGQPWHTECTLSTEDKDFYMLLARNVIVEFSEGEIVGRTSAQRLKAVITKTEDSFRPPYEHGMMTFKRSCVFAMTTNNSDYQKDDTGGRRWLPVVLKKVADVDWLKANRDQMFAEALYRLREFKEPTHEYPWDQLRKLQGEKTEEDTYDELINNWYENLPDYTKEQGIRILDVYEQVVMKDLEIKNPIDKRMEWRIAGILRRVVKLDCVVMKIGGKTVKRWTK